MADAFSRVIRALGALDATTFINNITIQIQAGDRTFGMMIVLNSPEIVSGWLCGRDIGMRRALELLFLWTLPGNRLPPGFPAPKGKRSVQELQPKDRDLVNGRLVSWDDFIDKGVKASDEAQWSSEDHYQFLSVIRCWHFLSVNFNGLSDERMNLTNAILSRFQNSTHADRHAIALIHFFFAFPPGTYYKVMGQVFRHAVQPLSVSDEGLSEQVNAFISNLPGPNRLEYLNDLSTSKFQSLHDHVPLWRDYPRHMPLDWALRMANLSLDLLADGKFDNEALQSAILLFPSIPVRKVDAGELTLTRGLDWITHGTPMVTRAEILLKWCCLCSDDFAKEFLDCFESIFTKQIEDSNVRTDVFPNFLAMRINLNEVSLIVRFVENVRGSSQKPAIAALFRVMSKLPVDDLEQLASLTLKIWKDLNAGEAEMSYVRVALDYCGDAPIHWLGELEAVVWAKIKAGAKCDDHVVKQFQRLFSCGEDVADKLRGELAIQLVHLDRAFSQKASVQLKQLLLLRVN
jgi:hypothetical protein